MSKALLKFYFIGINLLAVGMVFLGHVLGGLLQQEVAYLCTTIASTSTVYAYLLNQNTWGGVVGKEVGLTFLGLVTFWFFVFFVLILWRATDLFPGALGREKMSYYFGSLEAFRVFVLTTMMPKIFPNQS